MFYRFNDFSEKQYLPLSGKKYLVELNGTISLSDGTVLKPRLSDSGKLTIELDWISGRADYEVGAIIAHTFKPTQLPFNLWHELGVLFADGNTQNFHPSNLVWKFPIGLGENTQGGFAFLPGFTRYLINRQGVVIDRFTNKAMKSYRCKGYVRFSLMPDIGPRAMLPRHRALCLTFKDYPAEVDSLYVNHLNGIKGFDALDNLEWATSSENRLHAIRSGLTLVNKPVVLYRQDGTMEKEYASIADAARAFGVNETKLSRALRAADGSVVIGALELAFKFEDHAKGEDCNRCAILVRDMKTGKVSEYESIVAGSLATGLGKHAIAGRIDSPMEKIYSDNLQFKRKSDNTPWYVPKDLERETLESSWAKTVLIRNVRSSLITEFDTQREAARHLKVSEATLCKWVGSEGQKVFKVGNDYIQVKSKACRIEWAVFDDPEEEHSSHSNTKAVVVTNVTTGEIIEFESASKCAEHFELLKTTLHFRLNSKKGKIFKPGLQFNYKTNRTPSMHVQKN